MCPALTLVPSNEQHRTVTAMIWKVFRAGSSWAMRRHAVTDQLSISSLAERLADVTAVVKSVGEESSGQLATETALALTERLETEAAAFPGDHMDIVTQPEEFAE